MKQSSILITINIYWIGKNLEFFRFSKIGKRHLISFSWRFSLFLKPKQKNHATQRFPWTTPSVFAKIDMKGHSPVKWLYHDHEVFKRKPLECLIFGNISPWPQINRLAIITRFHFLTLLNHPDSMMINTCLHTVGGWYTYNGLNTSWRSQ